MFRRPSHQRVLDLLAAFDADLLSPCRFLFGGGTRIVLDLDEYRESQDIDFLCSDGEGYGELRFRASREGHAGLFHPEALDRFRFPREMRIDQYGIRFVVLAGAASLRVELIREARIGLDPGARPGWSPVDCLTPADCYAEKLLANSDRWADRQVLSRDLIDLAALRVRLGPVPGDSWRKVETAYRSAARDDLRKALDAFAADPDHQLRCRRGLSIEHPEEIQRGMDLLRGDLGAPPHNPEPEAWNPAR